MMPISVGFIILARPIIKLAFMRGAFDIDAVRSAAYAFIFYSLGLISSSALHLINRFHYSLKDTLTPTIITLTAIIVNYFGDWLLIGPLQHGGIALSTSLVLTFNFICLLVILRKKIGSIGGYKIFITFIKVSIASFFLGVVAFSSWKAIASLINQTAGGQILSMGIVIIVGVAVYLATVRYLKIQELNIIAKMVKDRFRRLH